jgi:NAD(P)-dependent dehydrogenase (short-subunit alcohol dehydrogenase family)
VAVLPPAALPLAGRRALVVGVETPAGAAIAAAVAAAGADLALATMRADEAVLAARRLQRAAQAAGRHAATYAFDVTLGQNVKVSTRQVARELGGLDLLVSASTHYTEAPLARTGDGELAQLFAYNCYAHAFALRAAADEFARAGGGSALVVLDARAERAAPEAPAFAAAQAAALSLVRSLAAGRAPAIAVGALLVDAPPGAAAYDAASAAALGDCAVAAFAGDPAALAGALLRAQARAA